MSDQAQIPELEDRHARLFARLNAPVTPAALRGPQALENIFERANRHAEERLDSGVRSSLQTRFSAQPGEKAVSWAMPPVEEIIASDENLVSSSTESLRQLEPVEAPGIIWPRVRADLVEWRDSRRLTLRRRRTLQIVSAAAAILVASLLLSHRGMRPTADDQLVSVGDGPTPQIRFVQASASFGGLATTRAIADAVGTPITGFDPTPFGQSRGVPR